MVIDGQSSDLGRITRIHERRTRPQTKVVVERIGKKRIGVRQVTMPSLDDRMNRNQVALAEIPRRLLCGLIAPNNGIMEGKDGIAPRIKGSSGGSVVLGQRRVGNRSIAFPNNQGTSIVRLVP